MSDRLNQTIKLRDGRTLGYADFGDPQGYPVIHSHGFPGSRLEGIPMDLPAQKIGLRIIVPDRPGCGFSTFQPGRRILDWPDDVQDLADSLGFDQFAVSGVSGGGPYALACGWRIPERLTGVTVISGMGPFSGPDSAKGMKAQNINLFCTAGKSPWKLYPAFWLEKLMWNEKVMNQFLDTLPEVDRVPIRTNPEFVRVMYESGKAAYRQGVRGVVHEAVLYARPWGFNLEEIRLKVHLWQGDADVNVPLAMARHQAEALPDCELHLFPGDGHYSLSLDHIGEILEKIKEP